MIDNCKDRRFELEENTRLVYAEYRVHDGTYLITHVEADPQLRGSGAAGRLMGAIVSHARIHGMKLEPRCAFARAWLLRHPEAGDVVA